ncbi:MAG: ribokinase, partial [Thermoproteota archaeon]
TGAGDVFAAGYTVARLRGRSPRESLILGNAAAALAVETLGASSRLPSWEDVVGLARARLAVGD